MDKKIISILFGLFFSVTPILLCCIPEKSIAGSVGISNSKSTNTTSQMINFSNPLFEDERDSISYDWGATLERTNTTSSTGATTDTSSLGLNFVADVVNGNYWKASYTNFKNTTEGLSSNGVKFYIGVKNLLNSVHKTQDSKAQSVDNNLETESLKDQLDFIFGSNLYKQTFEVSGIDGEISLAQSFTGLNYDCDLLESVDLWVAYTKYFYSKNPKLFASITNPLAQNALKGIIGASSTFPDFSTGAGLTWSPFDWVDLTTDYSFTESAIQQGNSYTTGFEVEFTIYSKWFVGFGVDRVASNGTETDYNSISLNMIY